MKREEKNQQTKRRIMDAALSEFSEQGYGASSVNTICSAQGVSKGIIYHYFRTKDELFLACVEECFDLLAAYVKEKLQMEKGSVEEQLEEYFSVRTDFFTKYPVYQRIYCEAVITPPTVLKDEIQMRKKTFDTLNIQILEHLLEPVSLRSQISKEEVIETFRQFQDFINANYQADDFEVHEKKCRKALNILLYGVIERKEND
ncbi:MAG: TetR/AcrR family transcriptional regulator [Clostridiales bacterium]|nr:TetR/AcrR family transcriptional regulator [Clostridiales bacterium]